MNTATAARHSCGSPDWYTPAPIVEAAREVMGGIDLDPASDATANEVIKATEYFTAEDDGLTKSWVGRVFLNPPGKRTIEFWSHLVDNYLLTRAFVIDPAIKIRELEQAIWIGYSLEQLQTLQSANCAYTPLNFPICIPSRRIAFDENEAKRAERLAKIDADNIERAGNSQKLRPRKKEADSPSHGNYITYIGPNRRKFKRIFGEFGQVRL